ncbi:MAG: hypothetical protein ABJE95_25005 [Byssovorax sp.]
MRLTSSLQTSFFASLLLALGGCGGSVDIASSEPTQSTVPVPTTPPIKPSTASIACGIGDLKDPTRVVLAWARGLDLVFSRADGSSFVAHTFPTADPATPPSIQLAARGDFVAAFSASYAEGALVSEAVLLDHNGKVLWSETRTDAGFNVLYLGDGGALALGLASYQGTDQGTTIVVGPAGKIAEVVGEMPISAPTKGGRVAVQHNFSVYASPTFGWLDPASGEIGSFAYATEQAYPLAVEGGVSYVIPNADQTGSIVVSEGDGVTGFELDAPYASLGVPARHGFVVIQGQWGEPGNAKWRAQPGAKPAEITLPGQTVFGAMYYEGMRAGDLGELLSPLRDEHQGGLYRSTDLGATWSLIGPSFAEIADVSIVQHGGTYVVQASDLAGYFPMDPWTPPAAGGAAPDRIGPANELIRPADGIVRELPATAQSFVLSDEGGCVAYQDGGHLFAGAVSSGKTVDLGETMTVYGSQVVWLP